MRPELPIVAIIGQPNVGKSTLLNKIAGKPLAVTSDIAGTTRDRQYIDTSWNGVDFTMVDTAGLNLEANDELENNMHKQIDIALAEADVLLMVVDGKSEAEMVERTVLQKFRRIKKTLVLAINKLDSSKLWEEKLGQYQALGIKGMFPVSSINGRGIGDMLDYVVEVIKKLDIVKTPTVVNFGIGVSIVGKPNVGKSSIFNKILKEDRVVVSPVPGTTRTAIDSQIKIKDVDFTFIDTAGLKKKAYRQEQPDVFSGFQTFKAIRRSDVCFFVIDAVEEITKQDQRIASEIFELEKGVITIVNKIDLYKGSEEKLRDYISMHFPFLWMSPLFFVSAETGAGLDEALAAIEPIYQRRKKTVTQEELDDLLKRKMKVNPPKLLRDQKTPKVYSLHQIDINPPTFYLSVNHPAAISQQFRKYLENAITKELDFWGTPINLKLRGKDKA